MYKDIILKTKSDDFFPDFIPVRLTKKALPYSRMDEMVDLLKERVKGIKTEDFKPNKLDTYTDLYRFYGSEYYCFTYNPAIGDTSEFVFERVDTDRPWTITKNSEGSEHIHYFTDDERYEITDDFLNYGVYKN